MWQHWVASPSKLNALQRIWYKELLDDSDPRVPFLRQGVLQSPLVLPQTLESAHREPSQAHSEALPDDSATLTLKMASANVLTLSCAETSSTSITKQRILMQQFYEAGCDVVGLQETQHKHVYDRSNIYYHILAHLATPTGQDGIHSWISKSLAIGPNGHKITQQDINIVDSSPCYLVVKVKTPAWQWATITCRGPHSGRPLTEIQAFWANLTSIIQRKLSGFPIFFCGDAANAHLGEYVTDAVGAFYPSAENLAGQVFHNWLLQHDLFVPSTFAAYHAGNEPTTFTSPCGDYEPALTTFALPRALAFKQLDSKVDIDIDLAAARSDHRSVTCRAQFSIRLPHAQPLHSKQFRPDVMDLHQKLQTQPYLNWLHESINTPTWSLIRVLHGWRNQQPRRFRDLCYLNDNGNASPTLTPRSGSWSIRRSSYSNSSKHSSAPSCTLR